ncbi:MAG: hypothetical protein ACT4PU_10520 [Planctomycetota bacterium]
MSAANWRGACLWPLVAALALRLAALPLGDELPQIGDSNGYLYLARVYQKTGNFDWLASGVRPPLHRVLLAPGLRWNEEPTFKPALPPPETGPGSDVDLTLYNLDPYPGVFLIQIAMDLGACALLMAVTRRRFGVTAAAATGWLYAIYPQAILFTSGVIMAETPACLMAAAALLALEPLDRLRGSGRDSLLREWLQVALLGVVLGLGILIKELLLPTTVVVCGALLIQRGTPWLTRLGRAAVVGGMALLITLPWGLHNHQQHGRFIPSGSFGDYAMAVDNAPPGVDGFRMWRKAATIKDKVDLSRRVFWESWSDYPLLTLERALIRLRIVLGPDVMLPGWFVARWGDPTLLDASSNFALYRGAWVLPAGTIGRWVQIVCGLGAVLLFSLAIGGLFAAPPGLLKTTTLLMCLAIVVTAMLTVSAPRYRHGAFPFVAPFAGLAVSLLLSRFFGRTPDQPAVDAARSQRALWGTLAAMTLLIATIFVLPAP